MILLFDIGNTNTHLGLANSRRVVKQADIPTSAWFDNAALKLLADFTGRKRFRGAAVCSVVPMASPIVCEVVWHIWNVRCLVLTPDTLRGVGIDYPKPQTIGRD